MLELLGELLPYALTIAISPVPIIAVILMLMSPRPRALGASYLVGWILGIVAAAGVFTALAGVLPEASESTDPKPAVAIIQIILGALLLLLAIKQWRSRPKKGDEPELPKWMQGIDSMKPGIGLGLGFLLAAVNPKNLLVAAAAGLAIGQQEASGAATAAALGVFTLIAALTVLLPVLIFLVAPQKATQVLDQIREWLTANNTAIMVVLFVVLGGQLLGKGLGGI